MVSGAVGSSGSSAGAQLKGEAGDASGFSHPISVVSSGPPKNEGGGGGTGELPSGGARERAGRDSRSFPAPAISAKKSGAGGGVSDAGSSDRADGVRGGRESFSARNANRWS